MTPYITMLCFSSDWKCGCQILHEGMWLPDDECSALEPSSLHGLSGEVYHNRTAIREKYNGKLKK